MSEQRLEVITKNESQRWNEIVKQFSNWDVYYLFEYVEALYIHGDGEPLLLYFEEDGFRVCLVTMKRDISSSEQFRDDLLPNELFDCETPYGYGGPLFEGAFQKDAFEHFMEKVSEVCREKGIVSQFYRFHPVLDNGHMVSEVIHTLTSKQTIVMDLESEELILKNMDSKNRNMVRKAEKNNVHIFCDKGEHLDEFMEIYRCTMVHNDAEEYYFFEKEYFEYLIQNMKDNMLFFYAEYEEKIIAATIILYNDRYMHYHLSGTLPDYRSLASTNLMLYQAALWGCRHNIKLFHLGGGMDTNDSLFGFKKQFNKNGKLDYYIGRNIFLPDEYERLIQIREKNDKNFDRTIPYMIQYRR